MTTTKTETELKAKLEKCRALYLDAEGRDAEGEAAAALEAMRRVARRIREMGR